MQEENAKKTKGTPNARHSQTAETKNKEKILKATKEKRYTQKNNS